MAKEIKFDIKAREELKKGVDALADYSHFYNL